MEQKTHQPRKTSSRSAGADVPWRRAARVSNSPTANDAEARRANGSGAQRDQNHATNAAPQLKKQPSRAMLARRLWSPGIWSKVRRQAPVVPLSATQPALCASATSRKSCRMWQWPGIARAPVAVFEGRSAT